MGTGLARAGAGATLRELSRLDRYATMKTGLEPRVRRASGADASALAALRFAFRSALADPVESRTDFLVRCAAWMRTHLDDDTHWRAWIVEIDDEPVGTVWLQIIEKLPNPVLERELHAYVTNLFVLPEIAGTAPADYSCRRCSRNARRSTSIRSFSGQRRRADRFTSVMDSPSPMR